MRETYSWSRSISLVHFGFGRPRSCSVKTYSHRPVNKWRPMNKFFSNSTCRRRTHTAISTVITNKVNPSKPYPQCLISKCIFYYILPLIEAITSSLWVQKTCQTVLPYLNLIEATLNSWQKNFNRNMLLPVFLLVQLHILVPSHGLMLYPLLSSPMYTYNEKCKFPAKL